MRLLTVLCMVALVATAVPSAAVPIPGTLLTSGWNTSSSFCYFMDGASDSIITPSVNFVLGDISPDSTQVTYSVTTSGAYFYAQSGDVWVADVDGSNPMNLTAKAGVAGVNCTSAWSPDGSMIAFQHGDPVTDQMPCDAGWQIWVMNSDGTNAHQLMPPGWHATWFPTWSPDGYRILCEDWQLACITVDLGGTDVRLVPGVNGEDAKWSRDGSRLVDSSVDPDTVYRQPGVWRRLRLSNPDGTDPEVLVEQFIPDASVEAHIAKYSFQPSDFDWLTNIRALVGPLNPRWSPTGDQVAFIAALPFDPDGVEYWYQREVWLYDLNTHLLTRLTNDENSDNWLSWAGPNTSSASPRVTVDNTSVTFSQVNQEGWTSIIRVEDLPALPTPYLRVGNFYELRTTAEVTGPATVAMTYADGDVADTAESHLSILRYDETQSEWQDVTVSLHPLVDEVRGEPDELGLMGLALPLPDSPFLDVSSSASNPYWALWEIEAAYEAGIVSGFPDGTYQPSASVTRAQMAVFLVRALGQEPANPLDPQSWKDAYGYDAAVPTTWAVDFTDVPASGWGSPAGPYWAWFHIQRLYEIGVTQGVTATEYGPGREVLRDQMAVFLIRALGQECSNPCVDTTCWPYDPATPATWAHDFADTPATGQATCHGAHWAWYHIQALYETGVTLGCGDGTNYCPGDSVRRDGMAAFLARAFLGM